MGLTRASEADASRPRDVRARARADAQAGLPAPDAEQWSAAEQEIVAAAARERTAREAERNALAVETERRLRALLPGQEDVEGPLTEAALAVRQAEGRFAHDYARAIAHAAATADDLARFRRTQGLGRGAVYPDSRLFQAGLLLCAAVLEAMFSAALFAEDDARGLLGGAVTAVGLSGANVALGFLAGFLGLRYLQPRALLPRIGGAAAFALLTALALFLNFFAAIWRQRVTSEGVDDSGFFASMFALSEPQAIVLLMLGGGVWVFATLKGYSGFDDPYPDYGKLARASAAAHEALSDIRADARESLESPLAAARAAIQARLDGVRERCARMSALYDDAAAELSRLDAALRALDASAADAVRLYRQENLAARNTPAPAYFSDPPLAPMAHADALAACGALMTQARGALQSAQAQAHSGLSALQDMLDEAQARLDGVGAQP